MSTHDADEAIFLLKETGDLEKVPNQPYNSEDLLQSLIEKYPELVDTHGHSPWHFTVQASLDLNPVPPAILRTQ